MARIILALALAVVCAGGCKSLTVAPSPIEATTIAIGDTNQPDADVIDCDANGCHVRQGWMETYNALEAKFKETGLWIDKQIKPETEEKYLRLGSKFVVPYKCSDHMADMKRKDRLAEAAP